MWNQWPFKQFQWVGQGVIRTTVPPSFRASGLSINPGLPFFKVGSTNTITLALQGRLLGFPLGLEGLVKLLWLETLRQQKKKKTLQVL